MIGSNQDPNNQQSQENEQQNNQSLKQEINWDVIDIIFKIIIGVAGSVIATFTYFQHKGQGEIKKDLDTLKAQREQTQLEVNIIEFAYNELFTIPKDEKDIKKKQSLVVILGNKFPSTSPSANSNLVNLMLKEFLTPDPKTKKIIWMQLPNNEAPEASISLEETTKEVILKTTPFESVEWSKLKVDIWRYKDFSCEAKLRKFDEDLREKIDNTDQKRLVKRDYIIDGRVPNFQVNKTKNEVVYYENPLDQTDAAYKLKQVLEEHGFQASLRLESRDSLLSGDRQIINIAITQCP